MNHHEERKQMAKDSLSLAQYEILFKQEVAAFVDLKEEQKRAKTNLKKRLLENKLAKQKGRALGIGLKLAELKQAQQKLESELADKENNK